MTRVEIWTDGACSGNPGPGGWGVILKFRDRCRELCGGEPITTNDSQYLRQGITQWLQGWKRNGWRTADKKPVKNDDLWRRLDDAVAQHRIDWRWVRGHAGHELNERADCLARAGMQPFLKCGRESG